MTRHYLVTVLCRGAASKDKREDYEVLETNVASAALIGMQAAGADGHRVIRVTLVGEMPHRERFDSC